MNVQPAASTSRLFADFWRLRSMVHSDKQLSEGAKCAWDFLLAKAGRLTDVATSTAELAHSEGRSQKTAYDWLMQLAEQGYITIVDQPRHRGTLARSGPWRIFLNDPTDVAIGRRAQEGDGQGELFDRHCIDRRSAEDPQILPAGRRSTDAADFSRGPPERGSASAPDVEELAGNQAPNSPIDLRPKEESLSKTFDFRPLKASNPEEVKSPIGELESKFPASAIAEASPAPVGDSLAGLVAKLSTARPSDDVDELYRISTWLQQRVPGLYESVAVEIATAVLNGYPYTELSKILLRMDLLKRRGKLQKEPAIYFTHAVRRSIIEKDSRTR